MHSIMTSAQTGQIVQLESTFETPKALPAGFIPDCEWGHPEESALV